MTRTLVALMLVGLLVLPASAAELPPLIDAAPTVSVTGQGPLLSVEIHLNGANPSIAWAFVGSNLASVWSGDDLAAPMLVAMANDYNPAARTVNICRAWLPETHAIAEYESRCTQVALDSRLYLPAVTR